MNDHNHILTNDNPDGIDRRGFLKCMAWAGTGVLWTVSGGVLASKTLAQIAKASEPLPATDLSFLQISDSQHQRAAGTAFFSYSYRRHYPTIEAGRVRHVR